MLPSSCVHADAGVDNIGFLFSERLDHHCDSKIQNCFVVIEL